MKRVRRVFTSDFSLLFASALLAALPLTFSSLYLLSWVSFVPFFVCLLRGCGKLRFRSAFAKGAYFGFFYHLFVYFWFLWLYPLDFAGLSRPASLGVILLAWVGISAAHGLAFAAPFLLGCFVSKQTKQPFLVLSSAIVGILFALRIQRASELAFPWIRISLGQYRAPALIQSASLFGAEGLDCLILFVSALLALALCSKKKKRIASGLLALLLFSSNLLFGLLRLEGAQEGKSIQVSCVQGCVLSGDKWNGAQTSLETYVSLTENATPRDSDLVIWPESAVPTNLAENERLLSLYQGLSETLSTPILMGCFWKQDGKTTNSAILLDEKNVSEPYSKQILVPFGERMPYRKVVSTLFPALTKINMLSEDLQAGSSSALMDWEGKKIGTVICFESIFPDVVRKSVRDGANLLVIVTNDSWYEDSPAVWQHLAHAVFRSVENGRGTVRCANSGVSAVIDENGRLKSVLGPLEKGVLTETVSFSDENTLYSKLGDVVLPALSCFVMIWFVVILLQERRRKNV